MRFTIRDLLWLTVVVAMALGWWVRERQQQWAVERADLQARSAEHWERQARFIAEVVERDGYHVWFGGYGAASSKYTLLFSPKSQSSVFSGPDPYPPSD